MTRLLHLGLAPWEEWTGGRGAKSVSTGGGREEPLGSSSQGEAGERGGSLETGERVDIGSADEKVGPMGGRWKRTEGGEGGE